MSFFPMTSRPNGAGRPSIAIAIATLTAVFTLMGTTLVFAQETTGTILGSVTDSSGAIVPGATVSITNTDRNAVIRSVKTDRGGNYNAPQLPLGKYSIKVEMKGFKTTAESGIVLNVNDKLTKNETLSVGAISETVSVEASPLQVDTQSAAATGLITGTQVRELALSSRNYEQLVALMPGVTSDIGDALYAGVSAPGGNTNETAFSLNGSFGTGNNWTVDGADNVDRGGNFTLLNYPSVDAIEEFKVLRGNYNAEYGRSSGGQINVITRSGTSKFHGGVYEFFRNNVLDANEWLNKQSTPFVPRSPFRYNDFGGTFGGPVFIPGHFNVDKSKTFFFFSEEVRRVVQSGSGQSTVPTLQERGLDTTTSGIPTFPYPVCLAQLVNGLCPEGQASTTIAANQINPAAAAYLKDVYSHVPYPQATDGSDILIATENNIFNYRQEIFRLDHTFNPRWSGFARIMLDTIPTIEGGGLFNGNAIPNIAQTTTQSPGKNIVGSINTVFTPKLLNQLEYAWSFGAITSNNTAQLGATNSPDVAGAIQLPYPETLNRIPSIVFGTSSASFAGFGSYKDYNKNHNVFDNVTRIVGNHTLKFGGSYNHYQKSENSGGNNAGTFTFQSPGDSTLSGGNDANAEWHQELAYFLLGQSSNFTQLQQDIRAIIDQNQIEVYGQDEYRIRPNLTLSYGLRYSIFRQPTDAKGHATSFDPRGFNGANAPALDDQGNLCTPQTQPCSGGGLPNPSYDALNGIIIGGKNSPFGSAVAKQTNLNFAPRVGVAWDPEGNGKESVRAGYGIFVESPGVGFVENTVFANPPFVGTTTIFGAPLDNPASVQAAPNNNPPPIGGTEANFRQPYIQQWDLDIQRELPKNIIADLGYYGSKGTHLLAVVDVNQPTPGAYAALYGPGSINSGNESLINGLRPYVGYAGIDLYEPIFKSKYHSFQASLQKRFGAESLITVNYTWSKNLTDVPYDPNYTVVQDTRNLNAEYSYARFDQRHVFNTNFVYQLPFFKEQHGFEGRVLGGWELSGIISANSGHWLDPTTSDGSDPAGIGLNTGLDGNTVRPNQTGNPNLGAPHKAGQWFNSAVFESAPASQVTAGNARKNSILGPGRQNWDLTLMKNIRVFEGSTFQFRLETFNTFNHTSFASVDTNISDSGTYGTVTGTHEPRILQLALKYNF